VRAALNGAHAYLGAPYGVYRTADGWLALAMTPSLDRLAELMQIPDLQPYCDVPARAMTERDAIKAIVARAVAGRSTADWLAVLQPADIWCAEVLDWPDLMESEAFRRLAPLQQIAGPGLQLDTTRAPLRIDGATLASPRAAPALGADREAIIAEFGLEGDEAAAAPGTKLMARQAAS
jgi:crotonobetainyl-CoA:carnitine CoA-transferase CaiB-like acyl-CoA transferase